MTLNRQTLWWTAAALAAGAAVLALAVPARDWSDVLEQSLESRSLAEAILLFGGVYVLGTLLLIPSWIFPIAAGAAFGVRWGLLASVVSATLAALAAYLVGRHVVRERVERAARRNKTFTAVDQAVRRDPFKVVALLRLSPILPSGLKSYFLGLTSIRPLQYTLASAAGMLPGIALKVWLGAAGRDALSGDSPFKWLIVAAGVGATFGIAWLVGRVVRKKLAL